jgi:hypothetical protein
MLGSNQRPLQCKITRTFPDANSARFDFTLVSRHNEVETTFGLTSRVVGRNQRSWLSGRPRFPSSSLNPPASSPALSLKTNLPRATRRAPGVAVRMDHPTAWLELVRCS